MKKALFIIPAAAMFILAGCQKAQTTAQSAEPQEQVDDSELIYIGIGGFESPTKVTANLPGTVNPETRKTDVSFSFEVGDIVAFVNENNKSDISKLECIKLIQDEEGNVKAGFTQRSGSKLVEEKTYTICYPDCFANFDFTNQFQKWEENYVEDALPKEHIIYSPSQSSDQISFKLLKHSSVLHFKVKGSCTVKKVVFSEYENNPLSSGYIPRTILLCGEGVELTNTPTDFYMDAIMKGSSVQRFMLSFYDSIEDGAQAIKTIESTKTISQTGTIYDFIGDDALITINSYR